MKLITKIFIAGLVLVKLILVSIFICQIEFGNIFFDHEAIASETENTDGTTPVVDKTAEQKETIDLDFIIKKQAELKEQEAVIQKKREELMAIQKEVSQKLEEISKIRNEINAQMAEKKALEDGKIKHLIKIYSTMKPQRAASLIEKMDLKFSIDLLSMMKGEEVGNILSFVDLEKAAKISEGLAKNK